MEVEMALPMMVEAYQSDPDPMAEIETETELEVDSEESKQGEKRWAEGRLAQTNHLVKKNKPSPDEGDRHHEEPGDGKGGRHTPRWSAPQRQLQVSYGCGGPADEAAEEKQEEEGLTGSDEWYPTRSYLPDFTNIEWGEEDSSLLDEFSDEVMLHVFKCGLAQSDLQNISLVCRRWWALSQDHLLRRSLGKGKVFAIGCGQYGQLGLGQRADQLDKPAYIKALDQEKIKRVCAARRHSVAINANGDVFSFGSGEDGKLGHGNELDQLLPKQILALRGHKVVDVSCGVHHTLLVTETGRLFSFGFAACGQLGHGDQSNRTFPSEVRALANEKVVACAAGAHHSLAVTSKGTVYSFGLGHTGQLGHGDENFQLITYQLTPKLISSLQGIKIVAAAAGFFNSIVIADDGRVFSFGSGGNGKLGHGDQSNQLVPKQIAELASHKVVQVSAGPCHTLALTDDGKLFSFGNGQNGRLGHGDEQYAYSPRMVQALQHEKVKAVSAGECHSLALTEEGRVYLFGSMMGSYHPVKKSETAAVVANSGAMRWLAASKHHLVVGIAAGGTHSLLQT